MNQQGIDIGKEFASPFGISLSLGSLVSIILSAGITLAGIIVIFFFIFGGINIIKGAGSGDPKAAAQGRQAITYAIFGFVIVFGAYWVIRLLEVVSGTSFLTNPIGGITPPSCPPGQVC